MFVFFFLEASQSDGTTYRLGFGCYVRPRTASVIIALGRLF